MRDEIRERIEAVRRGEVPEGYVVENHQLRPVDWGYDKIGKHLIEYDEYSNDTECYPLTTSSRQGLMLQSEYYGDQRYVETAGGFHIVPEGYITYRHMSDDDVFKFNVNNMGTPVLVSPEYPVFTTDGDLNKTILIEYLNGMKEFRAFCSAQKKGSTRTRMYFGRLGEFSMPIPTAAEQRRIAEVLDGCDRVIRLKQELIKEKQEQKRWVMNSLLNPTSEAYKADSVDCKWVSRRIKEIGTVVTGSTPSRKEPAFWDGKFAWITAQDFLGKFITDSVEHLSEEGKEQCRVLPPDTLLVTCIASIGLNAITRIPCATNQQINAVICNDSCLVEMLYYVIEYNKEVIKRIAGKTAVPIISKEQFENLKIALPDSIDEQRRIVNVLACIDDSIEKTIKECDYWQQKKKALMQLLLTGLVRVNA